MGAKNSKEKKENIICNIAIIGLENSGKTTLFNYLKYGKIMETTPTTAFNSEKIKIKEFEISFFDVAGNSRNLWKHFLDSATGIIFLIDSTEKEKFKIIKEEMKKISSLIKNVNMTIGIFFNKIDDPNSLEIYEFLKEVHINKYFNCDIFIQKMSLIKNIDIDKGMDKILKSIKNVKKIN